MKLHNFHKALQSAPYVLLGAFIGFSLDFTCLCRGISMLPTLQHDDRICFIPYSLLVLKKLCRQPLVRPNDIVVVKVSENMCICKRVIKTTHSRDEADMWGTEHYESIEPSYYIPARNTQKSDDLTIGEMKSSYRLAETHKPTRSHDWDACIDRVKNPSQWIWLEGDNPEHSHDSRNCGSIPVECLRGKVLAVLWPNTRLTK